MRGRPDGHVARTAANHARRFRRTSSSSFQSRRRRCRRNRDWRPCRFRLGRRHASGSARWRSCDCDCRRQRITIEDREPVMAEELWRKPAHELAALIREREISPVELLDAQLDAINQLNPKLNAIVTLATDKARVDARTAERAVMRGDKIGALHGLPIGVKDITA